MLWFKQKRGINTDQIKIGKFIQEKRKEKNLTQEELATQLGISKNAVSKWERGLCLMDMSLLKPLSNILDVSVNDILSGEIVTEKELKNKTEENIINLNELINLKSKKYGIIGMCVAFIILLSISIIKNIPYQALTSLICTYNAVAFISKSKLSKGQTDIYTGVMFAIAAVLNTLAFILK